MAYFKCKAVPKAAPGSVPFTETGTWTVPSGVRYIDIALVGSGGNGGDGKYRRPDSTGQGYGGAGGAGGYITRQTGIRVHKGDVVSVSVGSGATTLTVNGVTYTAAKGGNGGSRTGLDGSTGTGGSGQSGGAGGNWSAGANAVRNRKQGGSNGGNGASGTQRGDSMLLNNGGTGNGQNCYINGVLFSTGGWSGSIFPQNIITPEDAPGGANTGNGGDGASAYYASRATDYYGKPGGTGFALISWT